MTNELNELRACFRHEREQQQQERNKVAEIISAVIITALFVMSIYAVGGAK